jgi:hypothetical protein
MLTKSLRFWLIPILLPYPATPQTSPEMEKIIQRLDKLEDENRNLLDEIRQLRSELRAAQSLDPAASPSPATPPADERLAVQESRTADLEQSKVSASQRFPISLTGMLLFNAFKNGINAGGAQDPATASLTRYELADGASVRQTVLGLRFNGPDLPGGGTASGSIYMDFFSGYNNSLFRVRTAALDLTWKNTTFTVGQDKPIIAPRDPTSFAQVGVPPLTDAGNLWDWNPQVRVEQRFSFGEDTGLKAQAGVYQTNESYGSTLPTAYAGTLERFRPAYQGRLAFFHGNDHRRFEIAPGFSLSSTHVGEESIPSGIVSLDWLYRPLPLFEFSGAAFDGRNAAGLGALPGFTVMPSNVIIGVHTRGEWGQFALFPTPRLSFHIYAGEQANRASDLASYSVQRNFVYAGNIMYKLAPNVLAALEAAQTRTEYLGFMLQLNNHYDLAFAYLF